MTFAASFVLLLQVASAGPADLSPVVTGLVEKYKIPALGGAIVTSAGLEAIGVAGLRAANGRERVTAADRWHLGSCGKAMTATLAARLIDRGMLTWETTIGEVLGKSMAGIDPAWRAVSILWLLSHRSGAAAELPEALWERSVKRGGSLRDQRRYFVEQGLTAPPATPPNTKTIYSNAGYLIAGAMLEAVADLPFEDLVRREVFVPLGLTETGFGPPGSAKKRDQPSGHVRGRTGWSAVGTGPGADNPPAAGPAGTINSTLADWARFVSAHLAGDRGDERFLSRAAWRRLHTAGGADWGYSPGWVVSAQPWADGPVLRHVGSNHFWVAEATMALEGDVAFLIVTNVGDDVAEGAFKELLTALRTRHPARK